MSKFPRVKTKKGFTGTGAVLKNRRRGKFISVWEMLINDQKSKSTEKLLSDFEANLKEFNKKRNIRELEDYAFKILDLAKIQMKELEKRGVTVSIFAN